MGIPAELMRVLDRLAGRREAHGVETPSAAAHPVGSPSPAARALVDDGPPAVARRPGPPRATADGADATLGTPPTGGATAPTAAGRAATVAVGAAAHGRPVALACAGVRRAAAALRGRPRGWKATGLAVRPRACRVIRPRPPRRPGRRASGLVAVQQRRRVDWSRIDRERLHAAWMRVLTEHGAQPGEVRLLGVYGSVPLREVAGIGLARDGERALVTLRRARGARVTGDLVIARHLPTGRLLSALVPRPRRGLV